MCLYCCTIYKWKCPPTHVTSITEGVSGFFWHGQGQGQEQERHRQQQQEAPLMLMLTALSHYHCPLNFWMKSKTLMLSLDAVLSASWKKLDASWRHVRASRRSLQSSIFTLTKSISCWACMAILTATTGSSKQTQLHLTFALGVRIGLGFFTLGPHESNNSWNADPWSTLCTFAAWSSSCKKCIHSLISWRNAETSESLKKETLIIASTSPNLFAIFLVAVLAYPAKNCFSDRSHPYPLPSVINTHRHFVFQHFLLVRILISLVISFGS